MAVGILLLMIGFLFWMQSGLRPVLVRLQGEQVITAYLDPGVTQKDESKIVDSIRVAVGGHPTTEIKFVDSAHFIQYLKGPYPDLSRELENLGSETLTLVPRYVSVSGLLSGAALDRIRAVAGVQSAESSKDRYQHIVGAFSALRWVARLVMIGLCLALLTGLVHLSRMNSYLHRDALALLKLWGAGQSALRLPGMLSALWVGLLGGAVALTGWITGGAWLATSVRALSPMLREMPHASHAIGFTLFVVGGILGLVSGMAGGGGGVPSSGSRVPWA